MKAPSLICIFLSSAIFPTASFVPLQEQIVATKPRSFLHPEPFVIQRSLPTLLYYRVHDESDDEHAISKLRTRAGPTFQRSDVSFPAARSPVVGINTPLIISLILNQLTILAFAAGITSAFIFFTGNQDFLSDGVLNWSGLNDAPSADFDLSITPLRFMQGVLGAMPTIALSLKIEQSDDRKFASTNFSTTLMVMTLFGRRRSNFRSQEKKIKMDILEPVTKTIGKLHE